MNKLVFVLIAVCALGAQTSNAQNDSTIEPNFPRWSIHVSTGYGFPFAKDYIIRDDYFNAQNFLRSTSKKGSLGTGLLNMVSAEFRVTERIGAEVGLFANWGSEIRTYHYSSDANPNHFDDDYSKVNTSGILVGFSMNEQFGRIHAGLHNYLMCGLYNRGYYTSRWGEPSDDHTLGIENSGNLSLGWLNKISFNYALTDHLIVGLEGFIMLHTWSPTKGEFVKNIYNGQDGLANMTEEDRKFTYPETISGLSNPYISTSAFSYHLNSCGAAFTLGFTF